MGRQYKGLDHTKVTVKLDERQFDIVRQYGWKQQEKVFAEQDRMGKPKPYHWKMSDVIRDAIDLLGQSAILSDSIETREIAEAMDRDTPVSPVEAPTAQEGAGVVSLPSSTIKTAQEAAEAAGEAVPVFVARAVETQAQRDKAARRLKQ